MNTKECTKCHNDLELIDFPDARTKDGKGSTCKICLKDARLQKIYGVNIEFVNELAEAQDHKCYICGLYGTHGKGLFLDHNHETGQIRKLLCQNCNALIGHCKENPELLAKATAYIIEHQQNHQVTDTGPPDAP